MSQANAIFDQAGRAFAAGNLAAAEKLCHAVIAIEPRDAKSRILLADIALRLSRPDAALAWADQAITLEGRNPIAHLIRARALNLGGRLREAHEAAEAGTRLKSNSAAVFDGFGSIFSALGRYRQALDLFKKAVAAEPRNPLFLLNLAVAERMFGAFDEAERHCDQVIAFDPHAYRAYYIRADLRLQMKDRNHILEMETLLSAGVRHPQGEVLLRFALGKECEDIGEHARGFAHYKAGAAVNRRRLNYNVRDDVAVIDRIIQAHKPDILKAAGGFLESDPIFIVGLPRSGTTLVERIVAGHSAIVSAGELAAFPAELTRAAPGGRWIEHLPSLDLAALGQAYVRAARETGISSSLRFVDKFPGNVLYCGAILAALPRAKIILLKRDPMDSCFSLYKALFAGAYAFSYDLGELADYYLAFRRLAAHWRASLPKDSLLEVSYEDIVTDFAGQSRHILAFLGVPWEDEVLRFHESRTPSTTASAAQVRRPIYASSIGAWRNHAAELAPLRERLARGIPEGEIGPLI